jgi:type II secretory pathway component GspD/PulD (secretin)
MKRIFLVCILISLVCLPPGLCAQPQGAGGRTGQEAQVSAGKISLDIKGMDIIDVLKVLAMRGNLNIAAGKNVRGKVTVFLKNVDVMDALEIILSANGLAYEKKGDIINVMTDKDYELLYGEKSYDRKAVEIVRLNYARAAGVSKSLTQIKSKIGKVVTDEASNTVVLIDVPENIEKMKAAIKKMDLPTVTKTFILNYAAAKDVGEALKESLSKNLGEIKVDERMNKIVVTDLPERVDYIGRIISDFDERDKVVLIEAKIVQITLNDDIGYGIDWTNFFAGIDTKVITDLSASLPSGITWPQTFTYSRVRGGTDYGDRIVLNLLEQFGKTDVLSTPRITVANNQEAKVLVGTKKPFISSTITQSEGTTTTADNVEFVDVGVSLAVTPTVTDDGYINMKIKPEVSAAPTSLDLFNADGKTKRTSVPIVTTSEAETQLLIKDGSTIILAGLMKDTRIDDTKKIPLLGDVPVLGHFFRSRSKLKEKTELVIFLTPHILKEGENDFEYEQQRYLREHEELAKRKKGVSSVSTKLVVPLMLQENAGFEEYCAYVSDKIRQSLEANRQAKPGDQQVQVIFKLSSSGFLKETPRVLSAVDDKIKDMVVESVERSAPFFPFPQDYTENEETFRLAVNFE